MCVSNEQCDIEDRVNRQPQVHTHIAHQAVTQSESVCALKKGGTKRQWGDERAAASQPHQFLILLHALLYQCSPRWVQTE